MKHKKMITILLSAIMTLSLIACGETDESSTKDLSADTEVDEEIFIDQDNAETSDKVKNVELEAFNTDPTIEETILVDEYDVKITATDLAYTSYSIQLNLMIENNSDKDLTFISGSAGYSWNAVNGYMISDGYMNADVSAGKKANETVSFSLDELAIYGITEIADIQIGFDISDEDYNHTYLGPRQVRTSAADTYDYDTDTYKICMSEGILESMYDCSIDYYAEDELYDQNGIRIVSEALVTNKDGGRVLFLEVENQTSDCVYAVTADVSVNGLLVCSGSWRSDSLNPGTRRVMDLGVTSMLDKAYWEIFGISDIGEITCTVALKDLEYDDMVDPQEIYINISDMAVPIDDSGDELYSENGVRFVSKGMVEDSFEYSDDIHMLLLVENKSTDLIYVDDVYDSLSINGYMTDYITFGKEVYPGMQAVIDVEIRGSSLEKNGIVGIEDIAEAEISFEIRDDNYHSISEPKLFITY